MRIEDFVVLTQEQLFKKLSKMYKEKEVVSSEGNYLLVKGDAPVMLIAHMDTVHKDPVQTICSSPDGQVLMSPQGIGGDDRCGIFALASVHKKVKVKPWLLFTCDEETGGGGAKEFCEDHKAGKLPKGLSQLKCLIEIDRKGKDDAVYYSCGNKEFEEYITGNGFVTAYGTFSDICLVAPELGVAAVNLSSGYYNAHTLHEYIDKRELGETIKKVCAIVDESVSNDFPVYEYVKDPNASRYGYGYGYGSYNSYGDYTYGYYSGKWDDYYGYHRSYGSYGKNKGYLEDKSKKKEEEERKKEEREKKLEDPFDKIMYEELLDYYTEDELDEMIEKYGILIIRDLYDEEILGYNSYSNTTKNNAWEVN